MCFLAMFIQMLYEIIISISFQIVSIREKFGMNKTEFVSIEQLSWINFYLSYTISDLTI